MEAETARALRIPHTVLRGRRDDGRWLKVDRQLAVAYTLYLRSICEGCGQPRSKTDDVKSTYWEVDTHVCHACAAIDQYRKSDTERADGEKVQLIAHTH